MALVPQAQALQIYFSPPQCLGARDTVEAGLVGNNLADRFKLVEVELLRDQSDAGLGCRKVGIQVVSEYRYPSAALVHQGGDYPDGRGLAGTVWPQQCKEVALLHLEADSLEGDMAIAVGLAQILYGKRRRH